MNNFPREYAVSDGWAAEFDARMVEPFEWAGKTWQVVASFETPCCQTELQLVRAVGSKLTTWVGIRCPRRCTPESWTVDIRPRKKVAP